MIDVVIDRELNLQSLVFRGIVTPDEVLIAWRKLIREPGYDPGRNGIVDLTAAERIEFSFLTVSTINALMQGVDALRVPQRVAVVAPRDELFGVGRMYAQVRTTDHREVEVFRDRDSAMLWLASANEKSG